MFRIAIHKFPNEAALHISYAYFIMASLEKKEEALQELIEAENLKITWEERFKIFRYRRLFDELEASNKNKNQ
jgi:hypothetical protein